MESRDWQAPPAFCCFPAVLPAPHAAFQAWLGWLRRNEQPQTAKLQGKHSESEKKKRKLLFRVYRRINLHTHKGFIHRLYIARGKELNKSSIWILVGIQVKNKVFLFIFLFRNYPRPCMCQQRERRRPSFFHIYKFYFKQREREGKKRQPTSLAIRSL